MLHQQHRGGTSYTHIAHYEPVLTSTSKEGASLGTRPLHGKEILVKLAYIKILNTAEFRWDESDWLIAIVSTFPTVLCCCFFFSPQMHLRKQHGELEWHRDWDMTFARPGYFAANPNAIYTYHHMGRPPDPQTSWAQAMTCFSNLQSLSKSWTTNGLFGAFGRPLGIIAALENQYLWHSATFPVVGSVLCLQHLLYRGVLLCSTW